MTEKQTTKNTKTQRAAKTKNQTKANTASRSTSAKPRTTSRSSVIYNDFSTLYDGYTIYDFDIHF